MRRYHGNRVSASESFGIELGRVDSDYATVRYNGISASESFGIGLYTCEFRSILLYPLLWGEHSCIDCLLSMRMLLPKTSTREKKLTIFTFFVMALCYVQKCELSYNALVITQNCIPPSEIIIPNREYVIRLGIGEGANVIFKQVSHMIR